MNRFRFVAGAKWKKFSFFCTRQELTLMQVSTRATCPGYAYRCFTSTRTSSLPTVIAPGSTSLPPTRSSSGLKV